MFKKSQEDYLKAIYLINSNTSQNLVRSIEVARVLKISKAAVSKMLRFLQKKKLIKADAYSRISLTKKGLHQAKIVIGKHRLIEVFLHQIKVSKFKIHQEAHLLEHAFSTSTIKKLNNFLGNPKFCPEGNPIPEIK